MLVQAGEGIPLLPSDLRHGRFSDLAFCPITEPVSRIELVMAWSPEREGEVQRAFLNFMRRKKKVLRSSFKN